MIDARALLHVDRLVDGKPEFQNKLRETPDAIHTMIGLYNGCKNRGLLMALTDAVSSSVRGNPESQKAFVADQIASAIAALTTVFVKSLILTAIEAIHSLAESNPETQRALLASGIVDCLLTLMKRTRYMSIQVSVSVSVSVHSRMAYKTFA